MMTMYPAVINSPETVTMGAIAADTTTVTVQDISKIPDPPNLLVLGGERPDAETVLLTAMSGNTLTIQRGVQGTARSWPDRTTIARNFTAYDYDALRQNILALDTAKADATTVYTKTEADVLLADKAEADSVYTKTQVDDLLDVKADASEVTALQTSKADKSLLFTVSLTAAGWVGESAPYTQTVLNSHLQENMPSPIADIILSSNMAIAKQELESYALISRIDTIDGGLVCTCFEEAPDVDLSLQVKVVG